MKPRVLDRLRNGGCAAAAALLLAAGAAAAPPAAGDLENKVKAAFLFNFARFTAWPAPKAAAADSPMLFCVLDDEALAAALAAALHDKTIENHPVAVRRAETSNELRPCHVAYVGGAVSEHIAAVLAELDGSGVLTVYHADAAVPGGAIRFFLDGGKVRFEVNIGVAGRERLELSSRLLSVASAVRQ